MPDFPGLAEFGGEWYHTARWPEDEVPLAGRRIGVIGTGASGVQVVQEASKVARELVVFQRSPVTAIAMQQRQLSVEEQAEAKKTYREVFAHRNTPPGSMTDVLRLDIGAFDVTPEERERIYQAAWDKGGFHFWVGTFNDILADEAANLTAYEFWRDKVRPRIDDPAVADFLAPMSPPYPFGTKRPSLEQDYYEAFNQDNVHLVDLRSTPIERFTNAGIETSAASFDLDLVVFATGFDANTGGLTQIDLRDTDGVSLSDRWAGGVSSNLGLSVSKFPNMIIMYGPQSPTAFCNGPTCAEVHGEWIVDLFEHMRDEHLTRIESTPEAEQQWTDHVASVAASSLLSKADSWYMSANIPGKPRQLLNFPATDSYLRHLARRQANGYEGFVFAS
ncbi:MAG: NAD(P)/FAD-dependent oxidoreductase [Acidimicrobiales bacterium]